MLENFIDINDYRKLKVIGQGSSGHSLSHTKEKYWENIRR